MLSCSFYKIDINYLQFEVRLEISLKYNEKRFPVPYPSFSTPHKRNKCRKQNGDQYTCIYTPHMFTLGSSPETQVRLILREECKPDISVYF